MTMLKQKNTGLLTSVLMTVILLLVGCAKPSLAGDYDDYDDDVAKLLQEYQILPDDEGSYAPSVLLFKEGKDNNTGVDFETGLIYAVKCVSVLGSYCIQLVTIIRLIVTGYTAMKKKLIGN